MRTRRLEIFLGAAVLVALVGTNLVVAQQAPPPGPPGAEPAPSIRAKQILGAKVSLQGEKSVGTVDDIVLDEHGNVDYLIVVNSDNRLVTVPWDAAKFNLEKRMAMVHIAPDQFAQVPTYTTEQYPVFSAPAYRTQIYQAYGLTPGQQRRAIRRGALLR
jgi:hypothetical protein